MLPGEMEYAETLRQELADVFTIGQAFLQLAVDILARRLPTVSEQDQTDKIVSYRAGHSLCIKACKSFRSSLLLAEVDASNDLTIISRSMFETYVAASFVLRDHISLDLPGVDDTALTANGRALLYVAFGKINKYEELKKHKLDPDIKQVLASIDPKPFEDDANDAANDVGHDWAERFRKYPRTYSGLSLGKLSSKLGPEFLDWYTKVYGEQSKSTHATDFQKHVVFSQSEKRFLANWFPPVNQIQQLVGSNGLMLWGCLDVLDKQFHFAENTEVDLQKFLLLLGHIVGSC
ncbi:MAG: DUF5677 domain-containing protein [Planctomycetota bacterium]